MERIAESTMSCQTVDSHAPHPHDYFDRIYGLNLDRQPDRWARLRAQLTRFGIEAKRISAIDGNWPETKDAYRRLAERRDDSRRRIRSCSELGCLLSHIQILEDASGHGYRRVLVFEDDACLHRQFLREFGKISRLPDDWSLLFLGASQYRWSGLRRFGNAFYLADATLGTFAVAYDQSSYDVVLDVWRRMDRATDEGLTEVEQYFSGRCFVFLPNLAIADVRESNLRSPRHQARHGHQMRWDLPLYHLPVQNHRRPV